MAKKIVHYINQFFAGIGGEEKADIAPEIRKGALGPGLALQKELGDDYEIVATVICGDNYFGSNIEKGVVPEILEMIKKEHPDGFVAGPAFNAGRYGVACGTMAKAVQDELGIPTVTGMYVENPGTDMFHKDIHIIETKDSSADMRKAAPKMAGLLKKKIEGMEVLSPEEEGYIPQGIRVNYFNERRGSERAVELLVKKIKGEEIYTDYPMPKIDRVPPAPPLKDLAHAKIALITSGGVIRIISSPVMQQSGESILLRGWIMRIKQILQPSTVDMIVLLLWKTRIFVFRSMRLETWRRKAYSVLLPIISLLQRVQEQQRTVQSVLRKNMYHY